MKQKIILVLASILLVGCGAATWGNMSQAQIGSWQSAGITVENYQAWEEAGFTPEEAGKWNSKGVDAQEAAQWTKNNFTFDDAMVWKDSGKTMKEAMEARSEGLEPIVAPTAAEPATEAAEPTTK